MMEHPVFSKDLPILGGPKKHFFVVQVVRNWASIHVAGHALSAEDIGMLGFMPVFDNRNAAVTWRDDNHPGVAIGELEEA